MRFAQAQQDGNRLAKVWPECHVAQHVCRWDLGLRVQLDARKGRKTFGVPPDEVPAITVPDDEIDRSTVLAALQKRFDVALILRKGVLDPCVQEVAEWLRAHFLRQKYA